MKNLLFAVAVASCAFAASAEVKIGIVGIDTSHAIEFTKHINVDKDREIFKDFRITAAYKYGSRSIASSTNRYPKYEAQLKEMGVEMMPSIKELLAKVDVVMLETNDGREHFAQAREIFASGKRVFIDKPVAHNYADAMRIIREARRTKTPFFSCSTLRWTKNVQAARKGELGKVRGLDFAAPCNVEKTHSRYTWYGIHGFEPVVAVLGVGADAVTTLANDKEDVITVSRKDGRFAVLRMMRGEGMWNYASRLYTEDKGPVDLGGNEGYALMLEEILKFFRTGVAPFPIEETEEIFALMEAAAESHRLKGATVSLDTIRERYAAASNAPGRLDPPDLTRIARFDRPKSKGAVIAKGKYPQLPIVLTVNHATRPAAAYLQKVIFEMTGAKLRLIEENTNNPKTVWTNAPAIFIGDTLAVKAAGLGHAGRVTLPAGEDAKPQFGTEAERFRVLVKDGSVYLIGNAPHLAVYDFCERALGVRQYWDEKSGGRSVIKQEGLSMYPIDWTDAPQFDYRDLWPYEHMEWTRLWKGGGAHGVCHHVHAPHNWTRDPAFNYLETRPEIFALQDDGKRGAMCLLCYSNPKTLETYLERIDAAIAANDNQAAGGIVDLRTKIITVSQADIAVYCNCERCQALKKKSGLPSDSFSEVLWGDFTRKLAGIAKTKYPGWTISILPYKNTTYIPKDLDLTAEGNVECYLCTMPGLALLKDKQTQLEEENLIREWHKRTGRKVLNWHYIIWPHIFTSAPYLFGETIQGHYRRLKNDICGSFLNGRYDHQKLALSAYVWVRTLWNTEYNLQAIYDTFATRMFGAAAQPMREIVRMQEAGWNRQWKVSRISNKNIYGVSYPREDVLKMIELFAEAKRLASGDELLLKRIEWYEKGFQQFFKESEEYASGAAFPPLMMQKVSQKPKIDGVLDDDCWKLCEERTFVKAALDKATGKPVPAEVQTHVKAVWTPFGVTIGIKCDEPLGKMVCDDGPTGNYWVNDAIDTFIDFGGESGTTCHLMLNASGKLEKMIDRVGSTQPWEAQNVEYKVHVGDDSWSLELYLPYADMLGHFNEVQKPTTSGGMFWTGNFNRLRVAAKDQPLDKRIKFVKEHTRLNTRGSGYNRNTDAFSQLFFKE